MFRRLLAWAYEEAREKVDLKAKWVEIKEMGQTWGTRFIIVAVIWEIIEDGVFPLLAWYAGIPWLIPFFLVWHFEPVVWPMFFWAFRTYDRVTGKIPWEADRPAYSSHWRTAIKVFTYRIVSLGSLLALLLSLDLNPWLLTAYAMVMTGFNFAHERIWHDSNFGIITETDEVQPRRVIAKGLTYRSVSLMLLGGLLAATTTPTPWLVLAVYQGAMLVCYLCLETAWSKSTLGISGVPVPE